MAGVPFGWARHPAPMSAWVLGRAFTAIDLPARGLVVDPFAGSGTTGTLASARGDRFFGIEAHPLTADLARVKFDRPGPPQDLRSLGADFCATARRLAAKASLTQENPALARSLPGNVLLVLAAMRDLVHTSGPWAGHVRWAVLGALREVAGSRWPKPRDRRAWPDIAPEAMVLRRLSRMADDLDTAPREPDAIVRTDDARDEEAWVLPATVDGCVSSPPYFNQLAYAEAYRLELYFLGAASNWAGLQSLGSSLMRSCVQQVSTAAARQAWEMLQAYPESYRRLEMLGAALHAAGEDRGQPKRYDLLLPAYFADLADVLQHLRRCMKPGGRAAWVVGESAPYSCRVDSPHLIMALAEELGFRCVSDRVVGTRGGRWRGVGQRHCEMLSERLVVLERPRIWSQPSLPGLDVAN